MTCGSPRRGAALRSLSAALCLSVCVGVSLAWLLGVPGTFVREAAAQPMVAGTGYASRTVVTAEGALLDVDTINGAPTPPADAVRAIADLAGLADATARAQTGINILSGVPAFSWCFGCSATSAAMIAGYYDRHGYRNIYTGPANGGVIPLDNDAFWAPWYDRYGGLRYRCPLSATQQGLDGRQTRGHVDDYWVGYKLSGPDPFMYMNWSEHPRGECTADFMRTSQYAADNPDGGTRFKFWPDGARTYPNDIKADGYYPISGLCGLVEFYESRGYEVVTAYNQYIDTLVAAGFSFDDFKAEIDAGRPVMFHFRNLVKKIGHTMVAIGYDALIKVMYIHDTWDHEVHQMAWGGTYADMTQYATSIVVLAPAPPMALSPAVPGLLLHDEQ